VPFPTTEECIAAAESQLGVRLPPEYRNRLASHNAGDLITARDKWRVFPVLDISDAKQAARTAHHLVMKTQQAAIRHGFPEGAVAVAENGFGNLLVFLPGSAKGTLDGRLQRWDHVTLRCTPTALDYGSTNDAFMEVPKSLRDPLVRQARLAAIGEPHVASLTALVRELRDEMGAKYSVPHFDPADGGTNARLLYLLEAPAASAIASGFVSQDNPDATTKNFQRLNRAAGIDRSQTALWNIVPWYVVSGTRPRPGKAPVTTASASHLERLFGLLPHLRCVVLVGAPAAKAAPIIATLRPGALSFEAPQPSAVFLNRSAGNRDRILSILKAAAARIA
jgi:uracil-DNA glycosylase